MRIALVNTHRARVGGAETYLDTIVPALSAAGMRLALLSEIDASAELPSIRLPADAPCWPAHEIGWPRALTNLADWRPDVIYAHGMHDVAAAGRIIEIAPSVLFAHGYYGTCISGHKMFAVPSARPCARRFGWPCLVQFYPRRCGGLSPSRMLRGYRGQSARLALMHRYCAVLTASEHMRAELLNHGLSADRVHAVRLPIALPHAPQAEQAAREKAPAANRPLRLLYVGRMTPLKGGPLMFDALELAADSLAQPLSAVFVGDGPDRARWERKARKMPVAGKLAIEFRGWMDAAGLDRLMRESDLLVVPSTWPEPFGLAGAEAGLRGLPAVAFAVGGIPEWLRDGLNGRLAPGDPPSAAGLAQAIVDCLRDPAELERLRRGARAAAAGFSVEAHVDALLGIFSRIAAAAPARSASRR
ncbi:MAG TPA: glycosyltransferase family 4 protein [Candidatus Binataceae bacterium]|nr:glycosyltransferase family 4 protein [Candidatus Binataceae bacterium]